VSKAAKEGNPSDLLFVNREGPLGDVVVGVHLGHVNHEKIKIAIIRGLRNVVSRSATLDFWRADFGLFRRLGDGVPWEAVLKEQGVQEGWTFFRNKILKAQEQASPMC